MSVRIAVNGYGRIGRSVVRALYEKRMREHLQLVAINEPGTPGALAHLTRYDTVHGRFNFEVREQDGSLCIDGDEMALFSEKTPARLPWKTLGVDVVLECSGRFSSRAELRTHLAAGAGAVLLSHPGEQALPAVVLGVNDALLAEHPLLVSCASCTSNAAALVLQCIDDAFGIEAGLVTTVHAAMNDQPVLDSFHTDELRRTRAAMASVIPVETALAQGIGRLLPRLQGRLAAIAVRVPTLNVSALDLSLQLRRNADAEAANRVLEEAARGRLAGLLGCVQEPLVSCDFNHDARSAIVDAGLSRSAGPHLLKLFVWFDNEWSYANRLLEVARKMGEVSGRHTDKV